MEEIKPFKDLPLLKYFQHDLERIMMAYRLSDSIRVDLSNVRSAGNQVEYAVKDFFKEKLFPKYHVSDGHIVDANLKVSPQFDIIICENSKNPVFFKLADKSELLFYETVYCIGEVKRSFYDRKIISDFCSNIKRSKLELKREKIQPNYIETGNTGFQVNEALTDLPLRNPLLTFMFFVNTSTVSLSDLKDTLNTMDRIALPNFLVFLDQGIVLNLNKERFENGEIVINLYPEYETAESVWTLMELHGESNILTYQYMLIVEHLNAAITSVPNLRAYTQNLFDFSLSNFHKL